MQKSFPTPGKASGAYVSFFSGRWTLTTSDYPLPTTYTPSLYLQRFPRRGGHDLPAGHPRRVRKEFTAPLIFGVVTSDPTASPYAWNTAMVLNRDGCLGDTYDKVFPLYFGEYVPLTRSSRQASVSSSL